MRYTEQVKYSLSYHWGVFCEVWDMFTLRGWHWLVVGLLVVLCMIPLVVRILGYPMIDYYVSTPVPPFDPSLSQDIITDYYFKIRVPPSVLVVANYYWVESSVFGPLAKVLCLMSMGLLLVAYLREE